jgi:hypothetical protein
MILNLFLSVKNAIQVHILITFQVYTQVIFVI